MEVNGNISYASQDPWLFPATIRQNIIFGEEFDQARYDKVIRVCALEYDFSLFDEGDLTIVADKGTNLSKGQQARINLARAVYRQTNIYLFDDSLTALDTQVQDFIFKECFMTFLRDKICILVSQNPHHIEIAHHVIILKDGKVLVSGDSKHVDKQIIDGITKEMNEENESNDTRIDYFEKKASLVYTEQEEPRKNVYKETKKTGKVNLNIYQKYFQYGGGLFIFFLIILVYVVSQYFDSTTDSLLTKW